MKSPNFLSDDEESSIDTPPPPPPEEINVASPSRNTRNSNSQADDEKYHEQLKLFKGIAEFSNTPSLRESDEDAYEESDTDDDESHMVPPPPKYGHRRFWERQQQKARDMKKPVLYGCLAVCLMILIVIILSVGIATGSFRGGSDGKGGSRGDPSTNPSGPNYAPEETERASRLRRYLMSVGDQGTAMFNNPISPESQALAWMQYDDPVALDPVDSDTHLRIDQRFALLTLWFQSDFEWFNQNNWLTEDECTWHGVTCILVTPGFRRRHLEEAGGLGRQLQDGDKLVALVNLENNNLQGKIPADIGLLKWLKTLNLSRNDVAGKIHASLSNLSFLEEVYLDDNKLTGELTMDFSALPYLVAIDVSSNNLDGRIPDSIWSATGLEHINLSNNQFVDVISDDVEYLENLGMYIKAK